VGALKAVTEALKETIGFDLMDVMKANTFDAKTTKNINIDVKGLPDGLGLSNETITDAVDKVFDDTEKKTEA